MYWRHPEDEDPPRDKKLLLYLNTGLSMIGKWGSDCLLWMPLPKVPKELKQRLENSK
jgi:hypothetical protein